MLQAQIEKEKEEKKNQASHSAFLWTHQSEIREERDRGRDLWFRRFQLGRVRHRSDLESVSRSVNHKHNN